MSTPAQSQRNRLALVVMPVVNVDRPSISLTKLRTAVKERHGERIATEILYLCHDFADYMAKGERVGARDLHEVLLDHQHIGMPDWFFRSVAFPQAEDNATKYFRRYFPGSPPEARKLQAALLERRAGLAAFLDGLVERHRLDEARIVGFTSLFGQGGAVFALARRIKARNPAVTIVVGGSNCDSPMGEEYARHVDVLDYVFSGPGIVNFPAFVGHHLDGDLAACEALKGVFSKRSPVRGAGERAGEDLDIDVECDLDYTEFFESFERRYGGTGAIPQVHLETSRGCWWGEKSHCTFCGLNADSMAYRAMAPEKAIRLFQTMLARYRAKTPIFFVVDNILPTSYLSEVLPKIGAPPGTKICYEVKANLSEADVRVLSDAGVRWIQPGIEALSTSSLKLMKKGATAFVNLRLLKNCLRYRVEPAWNLLVGFPGESPEVYAKYVRDLPLLTHLRPPQGVAVIHFDRFSPYHFRAAEYGLKLKPVDYYEYCFPFPKESIENIAYYFSDTNYEAAHYKGLAPWLAPMREKVDSWRRRWEPGGLDPFAGWTDHPSLPRLDLRREGGKARIHDSRGEETQEYDLTPAQARLLEHLETERGPAAIRQLGQTEGFDAEAELAFLEAKGLLFREEDRVLGLAMLG